jgi:hypothetical protein
VDLGDSPVGSNGPVGIAVDASGIESRSTTEEGLDPEGLEGEEGVPEDGMHFAVDIKTGQAVSMDATSERVGDGRRPRGPVGDAEGRVGVGGPRRRRLRLEGELQLPRGGGG